MKCFQTWQKQTSFKPERGLFSIPDWYQHDDLSFHLQV